MRKTIIAAFAALVLFGFAVSGVMAQATWSWEEPAKITGTTVFTDFQVDPADGVFKGWDGTAWVTVGTEAPAAGVATFTDTVVGTIVDSVAVPPFAVIDDNTVGILSGPGYAATDPQPNTPDVAGAFKYIAGEYNGTTATLYVVYETTDITVEQHLIVGTLDIQWEEATVRFTPRSLNLGSNGKWVTCKVSELAGATWDEINLADLCIVGVNDVLLDTPICVDTTGPSNTKNSRKLMVKFDRRTLADAITAQINDPDLSVDPANTKITVGYSDGTLNFYGEDTFKTKPPKQKKPK